MTHRSTADLSLPGPGAYRYDDGLATSVAKKSIYNANSSQHLMESATATRELSTLNKEHFGTPGPGMYNGSSGYTKSKVTAFGFGTSKR